MSASFLPQQQINKGKVSLLDFSSPAAVEKGDTLLVAYHGKGNDGFWFVTNDGKQGDKWNGPTQLSKVGATNIRPAYGASPSPVIYNDELYIFYTHANGEIWGTRSERGTVSKWTDVFPIWGAIQGERKPLAAMTSPNTVVFNGLLYFFWVIAPGYEAVNRLQYATYDGRGTWSPAQNVDAKNLGVKPGTSACTNVFKDKLYVFYDGSGDDGTWMTFLSDGKWSPATSMAAKLGWKGAIDFTDPDSWTSTDGESQTISNGSNFGTWLASTPDGSNWSPPINIAQDIGTQGIAPATSARGGSFLNRTYLFWNGIGENGLWYTRQNTAPKVLDLPVANKNPFVIDIDDSLPIRNLDKAYSDYDEKTPFISTETMLLANPDDRIRAKGLLPTVRGMEKRYGWIGAILRKYLGFAAKLILVLAVLVMIVLGWHYVSPACTHGQS